MPKDLIEWRTLLKYHLTLNEKESKMSKKYLSKEIHSKQGQSGTSPYYSRLSLIKKLKSLSE